MQVEGIIGVYVGEGKVGCSMWRRVDFLREVVSWEMKVNRD